MLKELEYISALRCSGNKLFMLAQDILDMVWPVQSAGQADTGPGVSGRETERTRDEGPDVSLDNIKKKMNLSRKNVEPATVPQES